MKLQRTHRTPLLLAALLLVSALAAPQSAAAAEDPKVTERPIMEFVAAQGTFDIGFLIVPPVPNFFGWTDPTSPLRLSIDYAGLADVTCGRIAGTTFAGKVKEKAMEDGRAEVSIQLFTMDAITWVVDGPDFATSPVVFGERWEEDAAGDCAFSGAPTLGSSFLRVKFVNTAPGAPLPDLVQLIVAPLPGQQLEAISIHAEATGTLTDGTPAIAKANEQARVRDGELVFAAERVILEPLP